MVHMLDLQRGRSCDSLSIKPKMRFMHSQLTEHQRDKEPLLNAPNEVKKLICIHGVPHFLNDTKYGCKSCHRVGRMS
jgi:hypothetical protein